jgi:hypothetical protein
MKMTRLALLATTIVIGLPSSSILAVPPAPAVIPQTFQDDRGGPPAASVDSDLVTTVQNATRPFMDVSAATAAGYSPFLGCVSGTQEGAIGVHYVNGDLVFDGKLDAERPEALMYETRGGRPELLGVEYIVLVKDWHKNNKFPPSVLGQVFTYNSSPNRYGLDPFYALHVWAWRDNPHGTFVDWNPQVSCDGFTPAP